VPGFKYAPANFDPKAVTTIAPAATFNCGTTQYDTDSDTWTNFCGTVAGQPKPVFVNQDAGVTTAVLLPFYGFDIVGFPDGGGGRLNLVGSHPVIIAVYGNSTISGQLRGDGNKDVVGPGADTAACGTSTGSAGQGSTSSSIGGGGGAGGSFGTPGAAGGNGGNHNGGNGNGAAASMPGGNATLSPLRGGCSGGKGGDSSIAAGGAAGGGGGAVQLSVSGTLTVSGFIAVGGGGGRAGNQKAGGGGGGSGGGILLQGDTVNVKATARVGANGAAGGQGGDDINTGNDGDEAASLDPTAAPNGGNNTGVLGGPGGNGAYLTTASTAGTGFGGSVDYGGGGGGAGQGRIRIDAHVMCTITNGSVISPASHGSGAGCPP
jgi:hypothetical protein